jgi:hypothetical protein
LWEKVQEQAAERLDVSLWWQKALAVCKVRLEHRARGTLLTSSTPDSACVLESYDLTGLAGGWKQYLVHRHRCCFGPTPCTPNEFRNTWIIDERSDVLNVLSDLATPENWVVNGGNQVVVAGYGEHVLVNAPATTHRQIARILGLLRAFSTESCRPKSRTLEPAFGDGRVIVAYDIHDVVVEGRGLEESARALDPRNDSESINGVMDVIQTLVTPEEWFANGGDISQTLSYRSALIIQAPPETHTKVAALLALIRTPPSSNDHLVHTPELDGACQGGEAVAPFVAVFDIQDLLGRNLQIGSRLGRDGEPEIWQKPRSEVVFDIKEILTSTVTPERWVDNGGEDACCLEFGNRLIIKAPASTQAGVVSLFAKMRDRHAAAIRLKNSWKITPAGPNSAP